jgi:hypothetical protein
MLLFLLNNPITNPATAVTVVKKLQPLLGLGGGGGGHHAKSLYLKPLPYIEPYEFCPLARDLTKEVTEVFCKNK